MAHDKKPSTIELSSKDKSKGLVFPSSITPDLAYICGVLIGDGSIYTRKSKSDYIIKCVGNPQNEMEFYNTILRPQINQVFGINIRCRLHDSKTTYGFVVYSKALYTYLTNIVGLTSGKKDSRLRIPSSITQDNQLLTPCIRGLFDTDGSIALKKRYRDYPYYPVISLSSQSRALIEQVSKYLKDAGFRVVETYDYKVKDIRNPRGFTVINRLELNGEKSLRKWMREIGFLSPKHLKKIKEKWKADSGERI